MAKSISVGFISALPNFSYFHNFIIFIFFFLLSPPPIKFHSHSHNHTLKQLFPPLLDAKVIDLISQVTANFQFADCQLPSRLRSNIVDGRRPRMGLVEEIYGPQIEEEQSSATVYEYQNTPENRSWAGALPVKQGLYDPEYEKDACGVGFAASVPTDRRW